MPRPKIIGFENKASTESQESGVRPKVGVEAISGPVTLDVKEAYTKTSDASKILLKTEMMVKDRMREAEEVGNMESGQNLRERLDRVVALSDRLAAIIDDLHEQEAGLRADQRRRMDPLGTAADPEIAKRLKGLQEAENRTGPMLLVLDDKDVRVLAEIDSLTVKRPAKRAKTGGKEAAA
jgi:hypothetical protein